MNKNIWLVINLLIFSIISSCNPPRESKNEDLSKGSKLETLTVGINTWPGAGPLYIGKELGYFREVGIDLKINKIENFDNRRSAFISGAIDIDVANTLDQLVIYSENNVSAQVIAIADESKGADGLVGKADIQSLSDLEGRSVAYAQATPSDFFLRYLLSENGVDLSKIDLKPVADPQIAGNIFIAGEADAAVTFEPFLSQALKSEENRMIASTKDFPMLILDAILAKREKVRKNPLLYLKFLSAWFKSVDYYYSNRKDALRIMATGLNMDFKETDEILSTIKLKKLQDNITSFDRNENYNIHDLINNVADIWKANGYVQQNIQSGPLVNSTLINALNQ